MGKPQIQRLVTLQFELAKKFGRQYLAARELGIREDELSAILNGRRPLSPAFIEAAEELVGMPRNRLFPEVPSIASGKSGDVPAQARRSS